ncbi:type II secretion system F family protein [Myceligenerans salitolerans]|uniref:Type II secretion system F family protein n=1 Tax=Myceligenerans salitolerans TaxID=1230528 RepID=A0ABS3I6Y0_9MICO|nr:type II secretion system F family protein [Myceligenerans salitolerans]MBO0608756.1 type II secretion system F family protein [Myceligenerans salitolerans]
MILLLVAAGLVVTLLMAAATVATLANNAEIERRIVESAELDGKQRVGVFVRLDERLHRLRWGQRLEALLAGSGLPTWSPSMFLTATATASLAAGLVVLPLFGRATAALAMLIVVVAVRSWLERRRKQRVDRFVAQLPELARLLANGASAGLAVRRSLEMTAEEMAEPARSEVAQVSAEMALGRSLQQALGALSDRLPSRELSVLVQTLSIQGRAGGALVTALSGIGSTLEERRRLRREVATSTLGAQVSGYTVIFLAFGAVALMNVFSPGVVDEMLTNLIGQVVLLIATSLFVLGYVLVRRLAKVEV